MFSKGDFQSVGSCQKCINMYYNLNVENLTESIKSCGKLIILHCVFEGWLSERSGRVRSVEICIVI